MDYNLKIQKPQMLGTVFPEIPSLRAGELIQYDSPTFYFVFGARVSECQLPIHL